MMLTKIFNRASSFRVHPHLVFIMLTILTGLFSSSPQAEEKKLRHHQINLSGNIFYFSMPEDFSRDMPAADMVESLDISDITKFDNPEYGNLVRRWWDIKKPGWFGKQLGTVMMDISVQRVVENRSGFVTAAPYNIRERFDFMLMLHESFHQRYEAINSEAEPEAGRTTAYHAGLFALSGEKIHSLYFDKIYNGQRWMSYAIAGPQGSTLMVFALPLSTQLYLEVVFTYSPNHGVSPRELGDVAFQKMSYIERSFKVHYLEDNPFSDLVGKAWIEKTNTEVLEEHRTTILRIYGIDVNKEQPSLPE